MAILWHHLRRESGALIGWGVAVLALTLLMTAMYSAVHTPATARQLQSMVHTLPPQLLQFMGGGVLVLNVGDWLAAFVLSGFTTLVVSIWLALAAVGVIASDADRGTLEFLLALPLRRGRLLGARSLSLLLQLLIMYALVFLAVVLGLALIHQGANDGRLVGALAYILLGQVALAGTLVLLTLAFRDQTYAALASITAAAVLVFVPVFVEANSPVAFLRHLTPFDYQAAGALMTHGTFPGSGVAIAAIWAALAFAAAWAVFARQEV